VRGLVLIDVDNVASEHIEELERDAWRLLRACKAHVSLESCLVSFAFNLDSVERYELTFQDLRRCGKALATVFDVSDPVIEIALTLVMPQAADVVLERLTREAPTAAGAGRYGFAAVLTRDEALKASVRDFVGASSRIPWFDVAKDYVGIALLRPANAIDATRAVPPPSPAPGAGKPPTDIAHYTVRVSGGYAVAVWAATRPADIPAGADLRDLARCAQREPWVLSQIGVTETTVRGLARMAQLPGEPPFLGSLSPKDGVEIRGKGARPTEIRQPTKPSVGIGAARCEMGATVGSRLPIHVLIAAGDPIPVDGVGIRTREVIQRLSPGAALHRSKALVRFCRDSRGFKAQVARDPTRQPAAWWLRESKTTSELSVPTRLLVDDLDAHAVSMRGLAWCPYRLALRSPLETGATVDVQDCIAQGQIGGGSCAGPDGKPVWVAVLAASRPATPGPTVVAPIHTIDRNRGLDSFPELLWALPIVVAQ
jgi:hypothetical protein